MESVVTISLLVKGNASLAQHEFNRRVLVTLMEWFGETTDKDCRPGFGFPEGSLLTYSHSVRPLEHRA